MTQCGLFQLSERHDPDSHRTLRVARLVPLSTFDTAQDLLLPLWDATVIYASRRYWTVTGIEREEIEGSEVSLRQSWALMELPGSVCEEIESELAMGRGWSMPVTLLGKTGLQPPPPKPLDPRETGGMSMLTRGR